MCCSSWGHKESDMTEWLNWTDLKQDHQPIWEIQEPGETHSNLSGLLEEVDWSKGPLLVSRFQTILEFSQRRGICSGSFFIGHQNCQLKHIVIAQKLRVMFYLVVIFQTSSPGDSISSKLIELSWGGVVVQWGERKKGERVRLYSSLQQGIGSTDIKR